MTRLEVNIFIYRTPEIIALQSIQECGRKSGKNTKGNTFRPGMTGQAFQLLYLLVLLLMYIESMKSYMLTTPRIQATKKKDLNKTQNLYSPLQLPTSYLYSVL